MSGESQCRLWETIHLDADNFTTSIKVVYRYNIQQFRFVWMFYVYSFWYLIILLGGCRFPNEDLWPQLFDESLWPQLCNVDRSSKFGFS